VQSYSEFLQSSAAKFNALPHYPFIEQKLSVELNFQFQIEKCHCEFSENYSIIQGELENKCSTKQCPG